MQSGKSAEQKIEQLPFTGDERQLASVVVQEMGISLEDVGEDYVLLIAILANFIDKHPDQRYILKLTVPTLLGILDRRQELALSGIEKIILDYQIQLDRMFVEDDLVGANGDMSSSQVEQESADKKTRKQAEPRRFDPQKLQELSDASRKSMSKSS